MALDDLPAPETLRGQYLCELCEEAMTDDLLPAAQSPTGEEMAICLHCADRMVDRLPGRRG
jgi:hypothetical protein